MITKILDVLFPKQCVITRQNGSLLSKWEQKKTYIHPECCPVCKKQSREFVVCHQCSQKSFLEWCVIWFVYHDGIKKLLLKLKYGHRYDVAWYLVEKLALLLQSNEQLKAACSEWDLVISSIPSHWWRKYIVKWYNQSEVLAKELAQKLCIPYVPLLKKTRKTTSQVKLTRKERLHNLQNAFMLLPPKWNKPDIVILVDDIITTWSTLQEGAKTIRSKLENCRVWWAVIARKA